MQDKCQHYGVCGGCSLQHIEYQEQVSGKEKELFELFGETISVVPAPNPFGYRNRVDFVYSEKGLSFREKGKYNKYEVIKTCLLLPKFMQEVFTKIQDELQKYTFKPYDLDEHTGFLRYIVFRFSHVTKEIMIICTTNKPTSEEQTKFNDFFDFVSKLGCSSYWFINDTKTDLSIPPVQPHIQKGKETIIDCIGDVKLEYGPHSFFQSNTEVTKIIFDDIKKEVRGETVDVCCGVGAITLYVADKATSITGIEQIAEAIDLAKNNKHLNNKANAVFFTNAMKNIMEHVSMHIDTMIVDPPRSGLDKKTMDRILFLNPDKLSICRVILKHKNEI